MLDGAQLLCEVTVLRVSTCWKRQPVTWTSLTQLIEIGIVAIKDINSNNCTIQAADHMDFPKTIIDRDWSKHIN